jgi:polyhydroxyalkanoate synthesis regulator phasin
MTKRQHITKSGDTFEWEETEETRKAVEELHKTIRQLEAKAPDYGVGK